MSLRRPALPGSRSCTPHPPSQPRRTRRTASAKGFLSAGVELVLFCGGDGTARDICAVTGETTPVLGIPAGVKMYSGVFGITPARTAEILQRFLMQQIGLASVEIVDLDEEKYRRDEWAVRLYMSAQDAVRADLRADQQGADRRRRRGRRQGRHRRPSARGDRRRGPARCFCSARAAPCRRLAAPLLSTRRLLGIDAVAGGKIVGKDLAERQILDLLERYPDRRLILSPIGAQGFVLGRGNQPLSPAVIRGIGIGNIMLIATPAKLARTPLLRFDTGDTDARRRPDLAQILPSRSSATIAPGW